jgi:hypothetical protein
MPNFTTFFSTFIIVLTLLCGVKATFSSRDDTLDLFHAAVYNIVGAYMSRDDLAGTRNGCTVTMSWTQPDAAETITVPAVGTCLWPGVHLAMDGVEERGRNSEV